MELLKNILSIICCFLFLISNNANAADKQTTVSVIYPQQSNHSQKIALAGTVEAVKNARLAVLESGVVATLSADVGDRVQKGQVLVQLDDKLAQLKLNELAAFNLEKKTRLAEAKRLHQEVLALSTKQLVAKTLIEERKASIDIALAALEQAQSQFEYQKELVARHQLIAPFAGVIAKRDIDIGEWAIPQTAVFSLVSEEQLRVKLEIPQEYFALLANSKTQVNILPNIKNAQVIVATLDRIVAVANEQSRTFTAYVNLSVPSTLVAGMSVNASVVLPQTEQAIIWLPKTAIKQHPDGGKSVFVVQDNKAKRYLVEVVEKGLEQLAVRGVPSDLPIIETGIALLRDGESVNIGNIQ